MSETALTYKAREVFAACRDSLEQQIVDALISEVERLTDLALSVRHIVPPPPMVGWADFTDDFKAMMFDKLRRRLYEQSIDKGKVTG